MKEKSQYAKVATMSEALTAISTLIEISEDGPTFSIVDKQHPNIQVKASNPIRKAEENMDEWKNLWKTLATKENASVKLGTLTNLQVDWPKDSVYAKLSAFLQGEKLSRENFPSTSYTNSSKLNEKIKKDTDSRKIANLAFQAFTLSELLTEQFKQAAMLSSVNMLDSKHLLELLSNVTEGITALLNPVSKVLIQEAINKRIDVRKEVIPAKCYTVKNDLLKIDSFSNLPCGNEEKVEEIIKSIPQTMQLTLPPKLEQMLTTKLDFNGPRWQNQNFRMGNNYNQNEWYKTRYHNANMRRSNRFSYQKNSYNRTQNRDYNTRDQENRNNYKTLDWKKNTDDSFRSYGNRSNRRGRGGRDSRNNYNNRQRNNDYTKQ